MSLPEGAPASPRTSSAGRAVLEHADAGVGKEAARRLAADLFGVEGEAIRLSGERDQNFQITTASGERFLLKLSNSAEDPAVTDLQTRALQHLAEQSPPPPTPGLRFGKHGNPQPRWRAEDGRWRTARLLTFLSGEPLSEGAAEPALLRAVGAALAGLDRALESFSHPADRHALDWDLTRAAEARDRLSAVRHAEDRALAARGLELFAEAALPKLAGLRTQVIHNDLNPHNVLVDRRAGVVTGILDLGDAVRAPLVNDVAVAAAYHIGQGEDALAGAQALVRGYHRVNPLQPEEAALLQPLIVGRLAMTVAITGWRAALYPVNREYILRNAPAAVRGLRVLLERSAEGVAERLLGRESRAA